MTKMLLSIGAIAAFTIGSFAQVGTYAVGETVDDFTVTDTDGNEISLYEITATGKYVFLDFFFDTCPPCQGTSPIFGEFHNKYGCNEGDIYCLAVNNGTDNDAEVIAYEEEYGGDGNHVPAISSEGGSGAVNDAFGIGAYPTYCVVGPDNKLFIDDIWPVSSVADFEAAFGGGLDPAVMECGVVSLDEQTELEDLSIYPNPAANMATISFSSPSGNQAAITIYNMLGEVVSTTIEQVVTGLNLVEVDLNAFESGNYIVQVQLGDGIITSKLEIIK